MVLVWRILISLTAGHVASMLLFQTGMLWMALFLLAYYAWKKTNSKRLSLVTLGIGALPNVINISGVLWKDEQMAFALLLAVGLALAASTVLKKSVRNVMYILALFFVIYATTVRTNGLAATLPVAFFVVYMSGGVKRLAYMIATALAVVLSAIVLLHITNMVLHVTKGHTPGVMMSADIVNILPPEELQDMKISSELKLALLNLSKCSHFNGDLQLKGWLCVGDQQRLYFTGKYYEELQHIWLPTVLHNFGAYLGYKLEAYTLFLFSNDKQTIWMDGIENSTLHLGGQRIPHLKVKSISFGAINKNYVSDFGYRYFPFMFKAWFWLLVSFYLLWYAVKRAKNKILIGSLGLSALLNIASFFPASETTDYRYIYWSAIACVVAVFMVFIERNRPKSAKARRL
jgi:hypothetical protein